MQLDVPILLTHLSLALNHLRNQLSPLSLNLLNLPHLSLESLPQLPSLLPRLIQLTLHLLTYLSGPLELPPGH
jgi:hypothetical protein